MRKLIWLAGLACALGGGVFWALTRPETLPADWAEGLQADPQAGALVFAAAGCASCHAAPKAEGEARLILSGGHALASDFGTFHAPNISPDPQAGIGNWSLDDFANAVMRGVSPEGAQYYPAFPYTSYRHMKAQDVVDLYAFIRTLPASGVASLPHELQFPFTIRRGLGLWKARYVTDDFALQGELSPAEERGRYLAEALSHCGECHTPRDALGGLDPTKWLAGAPNPSGEGRIPNITPAELDWSEDDLVAYFTSGLTPDYDSAGGTMAEVVTNLAQLPEADRRAIAAYLKRVPAIR